MITTLLLLVALALAFAQAKPVWKEPRRRHEALLRNLLGFSIGIGSFFDAYFALASTGFAPFRDIQAFDRLTVACVFFGLGVAGCLCFYRKIFWFGTSVVAASALIPLGIFSLIAWGPLRLSSQLGLLAKVGLGQVLIPLVVLVLMFLYYHRYVKVGR
ncbi:MAG: hypothetical protein ACOYKZ_02995 [Chlamydiia bacterium]